MRTSLAREVHVAHIYYFASANTDDGVRHGRSGWSLLHCLDHAAQSVEIQAIALLSRLLCSEKGCYLCCLYLPLFDWVYSLSLYITQHGASNISWGWE